MSFTDEVIFPVTIAETSHPNITSLLEYNYTMINDRC